MPVHEIQCGSLVHFSMVNLGFIKSGHRSISFETGPWPLKYAVLLDPLRSVQFSIL